MTAIFKDDLVRGHSGEADFAALFEPALERLDGRTADFRVVRTGELVEIKTDFYPFEKTANVFMERYSYGDVDGGPWQALKKGAKYYVYMFDSNGAFYIFQTELLVRFLEWRFKDAELIPVKNQSHVTRGYKIPRAAIAHLVCPPTVLT